MRIFPERTWRSILWAIFRIALISYIFYGVLIYVKQDGLLYYPDQTPFADCVDVSPATMVDMNGTRGYFYQNGTSTKLAVLYHGNADRACGRAFYRTAFEHAGYSWLIVEYAGYANDVDTKGNMRLPSTKRILDDVKNVDEWVRAQRPTTLAIVGESIGTGPASFHSSRATPDALILLAPFDRLSLLAQELYPLYPIAYMLREDYDNMMWASTAGRVLIVHGDADTIIPIRYALNLFAHLPQEDKTFVTLPNVDHNESFGITQTQQAILKFLKETP